MGKHNISDRMFDVITYSVVIFALIITLCPFVYVISMSISSPDAVVSNDVILFPVGFSLDAFKFVSSDLEFWRYYYNTIWYTVVGTFFNVVFTIIAAYPISKRNFFARKQITFFYLLTMFISGGMIPSYLLVTQLGLYNTRWALIIPGLISTWNMLICRTFFQSLPEEVFENARLEGCSESRIIYSIVMPLSQPIIAVLTLYYAISHWNSFFAALLYLSDSKLHPLQIYLRRILIQSSPEIMNSDEAGTMSLAFLQVKYAVILVTVLPIIMVYPFLQKYFVKGVMIGSLKG